MIIKLAHGSTFPACAAGLPPQLGDHPTLYLLIAALCLLIALRYWRRAFQPIEVLVRALADAAVVAFTIGVAVVLVTAVALSTH